MNTDNFQLSLGVSMELSGNVLELSSLTNFNIFAMLLKFYILKRWVHVVQFVFENALMENL